MKTFGYISLALILIVLAFFTGKCYHKEVCPQTDTVQVERIVIDTIIKPDTVVKWIRGKTIYVPVKITDTSYTYYDTIKTDELKINIEDVVSNRGEILGRFVGYQLFVPKEIKVTEYITQPIDIKPKFSFYGMAGLGIDSKKLIFSGEIGINKTNKIYGIQYLRLDGQGSFLLKYGINF